MADIPTSRKEQLLALEKDIRAGIRALHNAGMKLKTIRDEKLYKEDGFKTWGKYCRNHLDMTKGKANKLIAESERREQIRKAFEEESPEKA